MNGTVVKKVDAVIIGAGPAGLSAAHELVTREHSVVILEQDSVIGGLARTVGYRGFRFDIGGHRFFTKIAVIENAHSRPNMSVIAIDVALQADFKNTAGILCRTMLAGIGQ